MHRIQFTRLRGALPLLVGLLTLALALATPAVASSVSQQGNTIIRECLLKDSVSGGYTAQDYQYALAHLPTDVTEYSDCQNVIRRAELAAAAGNSTGASGTGTTRGGLPRPLRDGLPGRARGDRRRPAPPPGHGPCRQRARLCRLHLRAPLIVHPLLPNSLLAALLALGAGALAGLGWVIVARVRARRPS